MLRSLSLLLLLFHSSCNENRTSPTIDNFKKKSKIENNYYDKLNDSLISLKYDTIKSLNLSKKSLNKLPNLSKFYIENLNLSNNTIDSINEAFLPSGLQKLILFNNKLKYFSLAKKCYQNLISLDLSNNHIEYVYIKCPSSRLNLSKNNLKTLNLIHFDAKKRIHYLNISNNPNFSNVVEFNTKFIDTIKHENISNDKQLISSWELINYKPIK